MSQFESFNQSGFGSFSSASSPRSYQTAESDSPIAWGSTNTSPVSSPHQRYSIPVLKSDDRLMINMTYENVEDFRPLIENKYDAMTNYNNVPGMSYEHGNGYMSIYQSPSAASFNSMGMDIESSVSSTMAETFVDPAHMTFREEEFHGSPGQPPIRQVPISFPANADFEASYEYSHYEDQRPIFNEASHGRPATQPLPSSPTTLQHDHHTRGNVAHSYGSRRARSHGLHDIPVPWNVELTGNRVCKFPDCTARFKRQEHLKRHYRKHDKNAEMFTCELCNKGFNRFDNLKAHIMLHMKKRDGKTKSARTHYDPRAMEILERMSSTRKSKKRLETAMM